MTSVPAHIRQRVAKLRQEIEHHRYLYHVLDRQEISDAALDSLKHELVKLEQDYPILVTPDSPTQRVGGQPARGLGKVRHSARMVSLEDVFSFDELTAWEVRWKKAAPGGTSPYMVDLKLDGLAMSLVYEQGVFVRAATRGDGVQGEDVTHTVRTIDSVPLRLTVADVPAKTRRLIESGTFEVRGEVVMLKQDFERLNARQRKLGQPEFANPRNVSAGSIRQLDPKLAVERPLTFIAWELVTDVGQATLEDAYTTMQAVGFKINPLARLCKDLDAVESFHADVLRRREKLQFWIDGVVVKVNDRSLYQRLGIVGKAPRAAVAYKFPAEQVTTVVEDIQIQVGRTGAMTPVAHLQPVQVAGTTVSRATLHNADEIARLDVRVGDTVIIQKAGDIIPDIVQVLQNLRPSTAKKFVMPKRCPVCKQAVTRRDGEVAFYCSNLQCPARHREMLYHFTSKKALDIEGLGPSTIDVLVDEGLVHSPADFFKLKSQSLLGLPLFAEKKATKLVEAIHVGRHTPLDRFIYSLGIRHVGEQTAIDLAQHFRTMERFVQASADELAVVPNIGDVVAKSIAAFFADPVSAKIIRDLTRVLEVVPPARATSSTLVGKTVVVTGTLETMSREQAHAKVRAAGGTVGSSVGPTTSFLVAGSKAGSKLQAAGKHGVRVLSEQEFLSMVQ